MIEKKRLKGKYITYLDKDLKWRTEKVVKIRGNYLTVINANKVKHRVYKDRVIGRQLPKRGLEEIIW